MNHEIEVFEVMKYQLHFHYSISIQFQLRLKISRRIEASSVLAFVKNLGLCRYLAT